jgi:hypothetical protein
VFPAPAATPSIRWTTSPAAASAATRPSAATTATFAHWAGLIHHQRPAQKILAIAGLNGAIRFLIVSKLREPESSRLTRKFVANDLD